MTQLLNQWLPNAACNFLLAGVRLKNTAHASGACMLAYRIVNQHQLAQGSKHTL